MATSERDLRGRSRGAAGEPQAEHLPRQESEPAPFGDTHRPIHALTGVQVLGLGTCLPDIVVPNDALVHLGCDPEWILQRTGIRERRHAPPHIATSDLAHEAARDCLARAGVPASEVDLIVVATMTPDHPIPSTACLVQQRLGAPAAAMDLSAACSGFMYALVTASQFIRCGTARRALVIGAEVMSRVVNPADKQVYPLFGDGAGAALLGPGGSEQGLLAYTLGADGGGAQLLYHPAGGTREPITPENLAAGRQFLHMDGRPVFKWAVRLVADTLRDVLEAAGVGIHEIDHIVLHQANLRIIDAAIKGFAIDPARVVVNLDRYGNTSAATIPLALEEIERQGKLSRDDLVLLCGFGAGLSWGAAVVRW